MPSELRYIMFDLPELRDAVVNYLRGRGQPAPNGVLTLCVPADGQTTPGGGFRLRFKDETRASEDLVLADTQLAASLMIYCRSLRIPLQAKAQKKLQMVNGKLSLVLNTPATAAA